MEAVFRPLETADEARQAFEIITARFPSSNK
jgi:hypothetical protein